MRKIKDSPEAIDMLKCSNLPVSHHQSSNWWYIKYMPSGDEYKQLLMAGIFIQSWNSNMPSFIVFFLFKIGHNFKK